MHKLKSYLQGQNLVEIAIILALVVVVGIVALNILGFEVKDLFSASHTKYEAYEPFKWGNSNSSGSTQALAIKAGQLNGTPDKPVSQCSGGMCSIDYGTFVLNSIPENFNEYVQTGGTSGGGDKLADLIMQIAEQYKAAGDTEGFRDFQKFSNLAHIQADMIRVFENKLNSDPNISGSDFESYVVSPSTTASYNLPEDLASLLPELNKAPCYNDFLRGNILIGYARNNIKDGNNLAPDKYASHAMIEIYDRIQSKTNKYPESLRNIAQELYLTLDELALNCECKLSASVPGKSSGYSMEIYDPITGINTNKVVQYPYNSNLNEMLHPQYSLKDDITGSLICTAGKNQAEARSCH